MFTCCSNCYLDVVKYDDQHQKCWIKREVEHFSDRRLSENGSDVNRIESFHQKFSEKFKKKAWAHLNKSWRRLEVPRERGVHDRSLEWPTVGR